MPAAGGEQGGVLASATTGALEKADGPGLAAGQTGPKRQTARGRISRDRIIDATLALLAEGGYPALSIAAICARANVSAASLYHHFGDKAGLIAATLEHAITEGARRFVAAVAREERPLAQVNALMAATRALARDRVNDPIAALAAISEATSDAPELVDVVVAARRRAWDVVAAEVSDLFAVDRPMPLVHLYYAFTTAVAHVARTSRAHDDAKSMVAHFEPVVLVVVAAIRPDWLEDAAFASAVADAGRALGGPSSPHALGRQSGETL